MNEIKYDYGRENDRARLLNLQKCLPLCKFNKMPCGHLDSFESAEVCDIDFPLASTVTARYYKGIGGHKDNMVLYKLGGEDLNEIRIAGKMDNSIDHTMESVNRVYDIEGIAPCLDSCGGGNRQTKILVKNETNCLNSKGGRNGIDGCKPSIQDRIYSPEGISVAITTYYEPKILETVGIKQATGKGYAECKVGGVADFSYTESNTRRGRVQGGENLSPTLTVEGNGICKIEKKETIYRIRKITPREAWRIMDFSDSDFNKASAVNSNSQLYKQAGNSICRNVLCQIFKQLNIHQGESNAD